MDWVEVNGTVLRYELRQGETLPTVLIHEMGGSLESWDTVWSLLPVNQTLLRYDTRGSGLSEKLLEPPSIDSHVDDLAALLDASGLNEPVVLAGVAVGAGIAIRFAARYPHRVRALIAMAPACGVAADARSATLIRAQALREQGLRDVVPALLERTWPSPLQTDAARYATFRSRWLTADAASFSAIFAMLATMNLDDDIPKLPPRSVLVAGIFDELRPPQEIDRLVALAHHVQSIHVASGHFMQIQSPKWVATLIQEFAIGTQAGADIYRSFMADADNRCGIVQHAA
ncbi:alpha/beta hydrolase [Caballeronia sp. LZ029]|uniref:alpha/beta fold hydrolase n=1 Tax=Caballeronia sp. LZ029 TaxID=3038564 RepID=UPI00285CD20E|nr:alpha/beta hydrolase [Caballeronia sp. LZ029]MDR5748734.1 alpha/beta hydrolase [Caballeronia sp. LZ029]